MLLPTPSPSPQPISCFIPQVFSLLLASLKFLSFNLFNLRFVKSSRLYVLACVRIDHTHTHTHTPTPMSLSFLLLLFLILIFPIITWSGNGHKNAWGSIRTRKELGARCLHVLASFPEFSLYHLLRYWFIKIFWQSRGSTVYHFLCLRDGNKA